MRRDLRVVVVGGGHVGFHAARRLDSQGHDVVIVEKDADRVEFLTDERVGVVIHGEGGRPSVLRETDLDRADVLAALTDYGAMTNLGICMTADRIAEDLRTVARIDHGDDEEFGEMVDAVVYPEQLAAHAASNEVVRVAGGGVRTIEQLTDQLSLIEVTIAANAPAAGKTLTEVALPRGAVVVANRSTGQFADGSLTLAAGDSYTLAVDESVVDEVVRLLRG